MLSLLRRRAERDQERRRTHLVVLDDPDHALQAVKTLRGSGFDVFDVHSPFPVHGMDEALDLPPTRLPWNTFIGGSIGLAIGVFLQSWTHTMDWPLNIGGKSNLAFPALVPVMFELTVLLAAFGTVFGLLIGRGLIPTFRLGQPKQQPMPEVTNDRFVLLVRESDGSFSLDGFRKACAGLRTRAVVEAWRVE